MEGIYDSQYFLKLLRQLTHSQSRVSDLSQWCRKNVINANDIVTIWNTEYMSLPPDRRLAFLYLVDDILQKSSEENNSVFVNAFAEVLPDAVNREIEFRKISAEGVPCLISNWERKFYGPTFFKKRMDDSGSRGEKRKRNSELEAVKTAVKETYEILDAVDSEVARARKKLKDAENTLSQLSS